MYVVANKIYESDIIVFFGSIRWGKMNAVYTQLIERLTWLENRHATLGESNILKDKEVGIVAMGHNWNGQDAVELEKQVLKYFGFQTPKELSFNRQWTTDPTDESLKGYKQDYKDFLKEKTLLDSLKESYRDFSEWVSNKFS
jgi:multimeric flavodoxin WrbA